jgi:hypothetical protein
LQVQYRRWLRYVAAGRELAIVTFAALDGSIDDRKPNCGGRSCCARSISWACMGC